MEQPGPDQIAKVVRAIGKRAAIARILPLAAFAIAVGLTGFSIALALGHVAGPGLILLAMGLTLLAVLAVIIWSWRRSGDLRRIARRTDFRLHLSEALSTSIDLPPANQNAVTRALQAYGAGIAARIDIRRAIPLFTRSTALALAMLTLAIFGTSAAYSLIGPPPPALPAETAPETTAEDPISADDIDMLAQLIADDAERRDSDYLKAVSNSLQELAQAARDGTPPQQLQEQLAALLDHAAAGYDGNLPNWMSADTADASALLQNARAFSQARRQAALARQQAQGDKPMAASASADMYNLPEDRLLRSAGTPPPGSQPPPQQGEGSEREGGLKSASLSGGGDFAATPMQDEAFESAGALPVGAAAQSGKGESNIAGGGSQPLAPDSGFLQSMPDPTEAMSIAAADPQSGSRIRLHVPTEAELSDTAALGRDFATDWTRQSAQSVSRQKVSADARALVSRYFNRLQTDPLVQ